MTVYEAIAEMRRRTEKNISFSFTFMSYSMDKKKSDGVVVVNRAILRKQSTQAQNRFADIMLNYFDLDIMENRVCWQPLIMSFENEQLELTYGRD